METIDYDSVAEIYDLYAVTDQDIPFLVSEARRAEGEVLELMAGTGRVSLPLARSGVRLTCVDAAREMLAVLSRKLERDGLHAEVLERDVRELGLSARFTLALLPFNSFMELTTEADQRKCLEEVCAALLPGGRFICTLHNPAVRRAEVDGTSRLVGRFPCAGGVLVVSGVELGGDPVVRRRQFFEFHGPDGRLTGTRVLEMRFALIERTAFEAMALGAGFRIARLLGDYDGAPFDPARSRFMIWVLEKTRAS